MRSEATSRMARGIFINYRRQDESAFAGRLHEHLKRVLTTSRLFIDVDSLHPGVDFVEVLDSQVEQCDVFLLVIGSRWLSITDPSSGARRLDQAKDFVRIEIESALRLGKLVIPILIDNAVMPSEGDLPKSLRSIIRRQAFRISHDRFRRDCEALAYQLERIFEKAVLSEAGIMPGQAGENSAPTLSTKEGLYRNRADAAPVTTPDVLTATSDKSDSRRFVRKLLVFSVVRRTFAAVSSSKAAVLAVVALSSAALAFVIWEYRSFSPGPVLPPIVEVTARTPAGLVFRDCEQCPSMVIIDRGRLTMGLTSEQSRSVPPESAKEIGDMSPKEVNIRHRFAMSVFLMTIDDYRPFSSHHLTVPGGDPCRWDSLANPRVKTDNIGRLPVNCISWVNAKNYAQWFTNRVNLPGVVYRLPSESEWEWAARMGTGNSMKFWWGNELGDGNANCANCISEGFKARKKSSKWNFVGTNPVDYFEPNKAGLHDMGGNMYQWVGDCAGIKIGDRVISVRATTEEPVREGNCDWHVVRGGGYESSDYGIQLGFRNFASIHSGQSFRLARTVP